MKPKFKQLPLMNIWCNRKYGIGVQLLFWVLLTNFHDLLHLLTLCPVYTHTHTVSQTSYLFNIEQTPWSSSCSAPTRTNGDFHVHKCMQAYACMCPFPMMSKTRLIHWPMKGKDTMPVCCEEELNDLLSQFPSESSCPILIYYK